MAIDPTIDPVAARRLANSLDDEDLRTLTAILTSAPSLRAAGSDPITPEALHRAIDEMAAALQEAAFPTLGSMPISSINFDVGEILQIPGLTINKFGPVTKDKDGNLYISALTNESGWYIFDLKAGETTPVPGTHSQSKLRLFNNTITDEVLVVAQDAQGSLGALNLTTKEFKAVTSSSSANRQIKIAAVPYFSEQIGADFAICYFDDAGRSQVFSFKRGESIIANFPSAIAAHRPFSVGSDREKYVMIDTDFGPKWLGLDYLQLHENAPGEKYSMLDRHLHSSRGSSVTTKQSRLLYTDENGEKYYLVLAHVTQLAAGASQSKLELGIAAGNRVQGFAYRALPEEATIIGEMNPHELARMSEDIWSRQESAVGAAVKGSDGKLYASYKKGDFPETKRLIDLRTSELVKDHEGKPISATKAPYPGQDGVDYVQTIHTDKDGHTLPRIFHLKAQRYVNFSGRAGYDRITDAEYICGVSSGGAYYALLKSGQDYHLYNSLDRTYRVLTMSHDEGILRSEKGAGGQLIQPLIIGGEFYLLNCAAGKLIRTTITQNDLRPGPSGEPIVDKPLYFFGEKGEAYALFNSLVANKERMLIINLEDGITKAVEIDAKQKSIYKLWRGNEGQQFLFRSNKPGQIINMQNLEVLQNGTKFDVIDEPYFGPNGEALALVVVGGQKKLLDLAADRIVEIKIPADPEPVPEPEPEVAADAELPVPDPGNSQGGATAEEAEPQPPIERFKEVQLLKLYSNGDGMAVLTLKIDGQATAFKWSGGAFTSLT